MAEQSDPLGRSFADLRQELERWYAFAGNRRALSVTRALKVMEHYLRRPLRLAIMGEHNSGKSSLINLLLREKVVPAGAFAGGKAQLVLRAGPDTALYLIAADGARTRLTSRALAQISSPDIRPSAANTSIIYNAMDPDKAPPRDDRQGLTLLPGALRPSADGTAKLIEIVLPHPVLRRVELLEARAFPKERGVLRGAFRPVDAAIWCTLATQAWKETERQSWKRSPAPLRRNAILLVTYKDAIRNAADEKKIVTRLRRDAGAMFPQIEVVSLRHALETLSADGTITDRARWEETGAAAFEAALREILNGMQNRRFEKSAAYLNRLAEIVDRGSAQGPFGARWRERLQRLFERLDGHLHSAIAGFKGEGRTKGIAGRP